ncbi:unnamed protein product [Leptidea sinapis]|uniref:USP domain-containing protein n=2 Tax=Leptidea sinapis TaxID=189913 RepID=A0A5E4PML8_9NEOP|nr:unnamed protein product [Leptidea sinapis]
MAYDECTLLQRPAWKKGQSKKAETGSPIQSTKRMVRAKPVLKKVGLNNKGNTCYMISIFQALLVARQFSTHVMVNMSDLPYWSGMAVLFAKMTFSIETKLDPDEFIAVVKSPMFSTDHQHDSSEFLQYLLELLHTYESHGATAPSLSSSTHREEQSGETSRGRRSLSPRPGSSKAACSLKRPMESESGSTRKRSRAKELDQPLYKSSVDSLFSGILFTRIECVQCRSSSISRDMFRDLQLAFPEKQQGSQYSVQGLLDYYCAKEKLTGDNKYKCSCCGSLQDAERSVAIEITPKFLVLVLKSFKFDAKLQVQKKLLHSVHHNLSVTLPTVRTQQSLNSYVLFAAVIHSGSALDSGHYYTMVKDQGNWYICNDDIVTKADEKELSNLKVPDTPYILFYRRSDVEEGTYPALYSLSQKLQDQLMAHNKKYETLRNIARKCP